MTTRIHNNGSNSTIGFNPTAQRRATALNNRSIARADGKGCCDFLRNIPSKIGTFFSHRHADLRMFFRSFSSMTKRTMPETIRHRINEINQFKAVVEGPMPFVAAQHFDHLSPQIRKLFYRVDRNYLRQLQNPSKTQTVRREIVRECERVVRLQRQLTFVNTFYRSFNGRQTAARNSSQTQTTQTQTTSQPAAPNNGGVPPAQTTTTPAVPSETVIPIPEPSAPTNDTEPTPPSLSTIGTFIPPAIAISPDMFVDLTPILRERLFRDPVRLERITATLPPRTTTTSARRTTTPSASRPAATEFNLNLPGTVAYVQNAIPAEIRTKGQQIDRLKEQFERLPADRRPAAIPDAYKDMISFDFMSIPVFDASHPLIQNALRGTISNDVPPENRDPNNPNYLRNFRHHSDAVALEQQMTAYNRAAYCPPCRHVYNRGALLIDTKLQDEILAYLRRYVSA
jgi:hypothetical protein